MLAFRLSTTCHSSVMKASFPRAVSASSRTARSRTRKDGDRGQVFASALQQTTALGFWKDENSREPRHARYSEWPS